MGRGSGCLDRSPVPGVAAQTAALPPQMLHSMENAEIQQVSAQVGFSDWPVHAVDEGRYPKR